MLVVCSQHMLGSFDPKIVELLSLCEGLLFATNWSILILVMECDALRVIEGLPSPDPLFDRASIFLWCYLSS